MIRFAVFLAVVLFPCSVSHGALIPGPLANGEARVRVRLGDAMSVVAVQGYDLRFYQSVTHASKPLKSQDSDSGTGSGAMTRELAYAPPQASEWEFRCEGDRVRAIATRGGRTLELSGPVSVSTPAGLLNFRNRPYRDTLVIYPMGSFCEVVNELGIEKYLAGLVNSEFNSKWNKSATEAQVIAARTYAFHQIRAARHQLDSPHYDVDSSVRDQVYDGYASEDYRGSAAVQQTKGWVLVAQAESGAWEPLKAFYSSTCAGHTELPQQVWGSTFPGFKHGVSCPYCAHSPSYSWELELSAPELARRLLLGAKSSGIRAGWPRSGYLIELLDVQPGAWTQSLRRTDVATVWRGRDGKVVEFRIPAARFREWIGAAHFRSTAFDVTSLASARGWLFKGHGNGHGVGMCQWGAKVMGERGYSMAAILKHYYPDALLRKVW
jgi:stage II sporulation protein D